MKQSKLQADIDTDVRIERGLKMVEFATQYYLQRAYLRANPLSRATATAQLMAELNQHLQVGQFQQESKKEEGGRQEGGRQQGGRQEGERQQGGQEGGSKREIGNAVGVEVGEERHEGGLQLHHQQSNKSQGGSQRGDWQSASKGEEQQQSNWYEQPQKADESSELVLEELPSFDSNASRRPMPIIPEDSREQEGSLRKPTVDRSPQQSRGSDGQKAQQAKQNTKKPPLFSDFKTEGQPQLPEHASQSLHSISQPSGHTHRPSPPSPSCNNISQSISKSQLNSRSKPGSQAQQESQLFTTAYEPILPAELRGSLNQSEASLLRQISPSFMEAEHVQLLMKLENCEMEQKFLEQRMRKRIQSAHAAIAKVHSITWKSLALPSPNYRAKPFNYAHIIE